MLKIDVTIRKKISPTFLCLEPVAILHSPASPGDLDLQCPEAFLRDADTKPTSQTQTSLTTANRHPKGLPGPLAEDSKKGTNLSLCI